MCRYSHFVPGLSLAEHRQRRWGRCSRHVCAYRAPGLTRSPAVAAFPSPLAGGWTSPGTQTSAVSRASRAALARAGHRMPWMNGLDCGFAPRSSARMTRKPFLTRSLLSSGWSAMAQSVDGNAYLGRGTENLMESA